MSSPDITQLLQKWRSGDDSVTNDLFVRVEPTLRRLARAQLSSDRLNRSIQPTELVSEAALKLINARDVAFNDRVHFYSFCGRLMRRVLVDEARKLGAKKRPANQLTVAIEELKQHTEVSLIELDDALTDLAKVDEGLADLLNLKFFCGLSNEEIAEVSEVSVATVKRRWRVARAWLYDHLTKGT